jgi:hypothetical protein
MIISAIVVFLNVGNFLYRKVGVLSKTLIKKVNAIKMLIFIEKRGKLQSS